MQRGKFKGKYRIGTMRLREYDYTSAGRYHVVICTKDRVCHFGEVCNGIMGLSTIGCIAHRYCAAIPDHSDRAFVDAFVVMPNHVHTIIGLLPDNETDGASRNDVETRHWVETRQWHVSTERGEPPSKNQRMSAITPDAGSLSVIINQYKGAVTRWAWRNGCPDFAWQSRFYDRIIRNDRELRRTRQYVLDNPLKWHRDRNHPDHL